MAPKKRVEISERSPLIVPQRPSTADSYSTRFSRASASSSDSIPKAQKFTDDETKSTLYLILLTLSIGGLQILWSVELSNGSPYLLSLGMSKALVAFVWLAGPMTGVLVQPYVGMLSDRCRISWGKRKPFMIAGTLGVVASSLLLAYARQIVQVIGRYDSDAVYEGIWKNGTIVMATVLMWCLDFSINTGKRNWHMTSYFILIIGSASLYQSIHRRRSPSPPTRSRKCMGIQNRRYRQCVRLHCWLPGSSPNILVPWQRAIPGAVHIRVNSPGCPGINQRLHHPRTKSTARTRRR